MISPSIKLKVSWQIFNDIFNTNQVLKEISEKQPANMGKNNARDGEGSDFVSLFVRRLLIQLNGPEEIIFSQGDRCKDIYFIAKGGASVSIQDTQNNSFSNFRSLDPGDHFGEIAVIYNCPRTAKIGSSGYCTFAKLPQENYRRLIHEMPEFETELRSYILQMYNDDHVKLWAFSSLKQLPFLEELEPELEWSLLHTIYHSMGVLNIPKGEYLYKPGQEITHLRLI